MILVCFQGTPLNITVIQVYTQTANAEDVETERIYEYLQDLLELREKKMFFHHRGPECKRWKPADAWSNMEVWPWSRKWSSAKTSRVWPRECTGYSKHSLPTTQQMTLHMDIIRWPISKADWVHSLQQNMEELYTIRRGADCGWDHEVLIAKFRLKLKEVGKTIQVWPQSNPL